MPAQKKPQKAIKTPKKLRKTQIFYGFLANSGLRRAQKPAGKYLPGRPDFTGFFQTFYKIKLDKIHSPSRVFSGL
jgi:hypothetical protein